MGATARAVSRSAQPRWGRAPSKHYFRTIAARACPLADRKKDTKQLGTFIGQIAPSALGTVSRRFECRSFV